MVRNQKKSFPKQFPQFLLSHVLSEDSTQTQPTMNNCMYLLNGVSPVLSTRDAIVLEWHYIDSHDHVTGYIYAYLDLSSGLYMTFNWFEIVCLCSSSSSTYIHQILYWNSFKSPTCTPHKKKKKKPLLWRSSLVYCYEPLCTIKGSQTVFQISFGLMFDV